jgi:hypothetical protein
MRTDLSAMDEWLDEGRIALTNCVCRTHYRRCDHPVSFCPLLDEFGQMCIGKGRNRLIGMEKA